MTETQFKKLWQSDKLNDEYADYIMNNCLGDRLICDGDMLIEAMEDFYLFDDFKDSLVSEYVE